MVILVFPEHFLIPEIFNLPNHANFLVPSGSSKRLGGGSYGFATAAAAPRQIQFGLKFYF